MVVGRRGEGGWVLGGSWGNYQTTTTTATTTATTTTTTNYKSNYKNKTLGHYTR